MIKNIRKQPLVSVLMTAYNREKYIAEAIESVLNSTYLNFELIIVDDHSSDNTLSIAKTYERRDNRIKVFLNEKNLKDYANRNRAASYAKGKYLKYIDSDDKIFDWGLEYAVEQMEKYPESSFGLSMIDGDHSCPSLLMKSEEIIRNHFFRSTHLSTGPSGTIIKREFFEKIQGYDTRFYMASDIYFNAKVATLTPVVLLKDLFFFYRLHEAREQNNPMGYLVYGFLAKKEIFNSLNLPLNNDEIQYLKTKINKEHATSLLKLFLINRNFREVLLVMEKTNYGFFDLIRGLIQKFKSTFSSF